MKQILLFILLLIPAGFMAKVYETQKISYPGGRCCMYRVQLADKYGSSYSLSSPLEFLSQRSIDRRVRQHLSLDSTDLPISPSYLVGIAKCGVEIVGKSKWNNTVLVKAERSVRERLLADLPFVKKVTKVFTAPDSIESSGRSRYKKEFNRWDTISASAYGAAQPQIESLNGIRLHNAGYRGKGKIIAVLDAGFMNVDRIPAFHNIRLAGIRDFVVPASDNIFQEVDHGTMVLSAMATDAPGTYIGTAPDASYLLIRCEDYYTESLAEEDYWAEAVEFADSVGTDVINSSLGYHDFDDESTSHKYFEQDGKTALISRTASMLAGKGIVLVNSVGNDGMGAWKKINFPADASNIITVGSISPNGHNAAFSSVGPTADGRIKPDLMAYGSPATVISGRGTIVNDMGTSFSSPIIAGLVACLWQARPELTARQIIDTVLKTGNNYTHPDNVYGYGVPDFYKAYRK